MDETSAAEHRSDRLSDSAEDDEADALTQQGAVKIAMALRGRKFKQPKLEKQDRETKYINDYIKCRKCIQFIASEADCNVCECGHGVDQHDDAARKPTDDKLWNVTQHTHQVKTDAYGEIYFRTERVAKYARVDSLAKEQEMDHILTLMRDYWKIADPNLIILVGGGAQKFRMEQQQARKFREGIIRAAQTTGAWIITCGTHSGVMKHIGKAIRDCALRGAGLSEVVCIGVTGWGVVRGNSGLIVDKTGTKCKVTYSPHLSSTKDDEKLELLDPYHTHFLLVDDGCCGKYYTESHFFSEFKKRVARLRPTFADPSVRVPLCYLMVEGGLGTLDEAYETVKLNIPVVIVKGSGRASDVFAYAYAATHSTKNEKEGAGGETSNAFSATLRANLIDLLEGKGLIKSGDTSKADKYVEMMQECLTEYRDRVTVFSINARDTTCSLDSAIIRALFKAKKDIRTNLQLCLSWNRIDLARQCLFENEEAWSKASRYFFNEAAYRAVLHGRFEFLSLFLQCGLNLKKFLTKQVLVSLYNEIPRHCLLRRQIEIIKRYESNQRQFISLRHVGILLTSLTGDKKNHFYCDQLCDGKDTEELVAKLRDGIFINYWSERIVDSDDKMDKVTLYGYKQTLPDFVDPAYDLFIYSVLLNRPKMAMCLLSQVSETLGATLAATLIYREMAKRTRNIELREQMRQSADEFELCACQVLSECFRLSSVESQHLLIRKMKILNDKTCIDLALAAFAIQFLSHDCVQAFFIIVWFGRINDVDMPSKTRTIVSACFCPPILFKLTYEGLEMLGLQPSHSRGKYTSKVSKSLGSQVIEEPPERVSNINKIIYFYNSPFVMFLNTIIAHVVFLGLLGYDLLFQYNAFGAPYISLLHNGFELYLIIYVAAYSIEEIIQVRMCKAKSSWGKLKQHFKSVWNNIEVVAIGTFTLAMLLGNVAVPSDQEEVVRGSGRIAYAISAIAFSLKILHWLIPHDTLGPRVFMVGRMTVELAAFMVILFVFIASCGLAEYSLLFPRAPKQWTILRDMLALSYWQIFENFYFEVIRQRPFDMGVDNSTCTNDPELYSNYSAVRCSDPVGQLFVPVLLGVYVVVTNVLLINLLIAIFNDVINSKEITKAHWGFQRCELILEFHNRFSSLPPPLSLFTYVYKLAQKCWDNRRKHKLLKKRTKKRIPLAAKYENSHEQNLKIWLRAIRDDYMKKKLQDSTKDPAVELLENKLSKIEKTLEDLRRSAIGKSGHSLKKTHNSNSFSDL